MGAGPIGGVSKGSALGRSIGGAAGGQFSSISDVRVRLRIEGGRQVRQEVVVTGKTFVDNIGTLPTTAIIQTQQSIGQLVRSLFDLRSVIATVGKALLSGFAITAVFGALFAAVNAIKFLFSELPLEILS